MKKMIVFVVLIFCIVLMSCVDLQFGKSIKGTWTVKGYVDNYWNEDTSVTEEYFYNPEVDQYFSATMVRITDNEMIIYYNDDSSEYEIDTMYTVSYSDDSLILRDVNYPEDTMAIAYYFNKDNDLIFVLELYDDYKNEMYWEKYNGSFPPESWLSEIEVDGYEPDGDIDNASEIRLNNVQDHTLTQNDSDFYCLQAREGSSYLIRGLGYFNFEMYLYDHNGDPLAYDFRNVKHIDGLSEETQSVILWTCEADGEYYPMVMPLRSSWRDYQGYYQMLIEEVDTNDIEYYEPPIFMKSLSKNKVLEFFDRIKNK